MLSAPLAAAIQFAKHYNHQHVVDYLESLNISDDCLNLIKQAISDNAPLTALAKLAKSKLDSKTIIDLLIQIWNNNNNSALQITEILLPDEYLELIQFYSTDKSKVISILKFILTQESE